MILSSYATGKVRNSMIFRMPLGTAKNYMILSKYASGVVRNSMILPKCAFKRSQKLSYDIVKVCLWGGQELHDNYCQSTPSNTTRNYMILSKYAFGAVRSSMILPRYAFRHSQKLYDIVKVALWGAQKLHDNAKVCFQTQPETT